MNVHLRRRETDTWRFVHRFCHIARQATNPVVNPFDRRGDLLEARIGKSEYR